jgi:pimeloyl-ACP methyl ester carboxylesterase
VGATASSQEGNLMAITERENEQIERANASGNAPALFIHGLWLLPSSWDNWARVFEEAGYPALAPVWPDDPLTVDEARANPDVFAKKTIGQIADHTAAVIDRLNKKPAVLGHSTGGLLAQIIAGRGLAAATVAIDPGPFRGVLPLPLSALKSASPVLANPLNKGRAVTLTLDQFKYGWANALSDEEAKQLYDAYHVAAPGVALMQMANANLNPFTEARADTKNPERGPLLIIDGEKDHTVPWAIANASYKRQSRNKGVTEIVKVPNRGHSLTIDSGWRGLRHLARVRQTVRLTSKRRSGVEGAQRWRRAGVAGRLVRWAMARSRSAWRRSRTRRRSHGSCTTSTPSSRSRPRESRG